MYYVIDRENKLAIFDDNEERLETTREFMPQLQGQHTLETNIITADELREHPNKVIVSDISIEIDVPDFEAVDREVELPVTDEDGNYICDDEGNPVTHIETQQVMVQTGAHTETITVKGLVLNPDYEKEEQEKERAKLNLLSLTKREVFLALYRAKGITPDMVRGSITDDEALIEFDYAERFYRGNPLIDSIGIMLGYSIEDLDYLFTHKELPPTPQPEPEPTDTDSDSDIDIDIDTDTDEDTTYTNK